jgi:DNA-binding transcriptional regulator YdaS (Cro superfamily)
LSWISKRLYTWGMRLDQWIASQEYGALSRLARATGLAYGTVFGMYRRRGRPTYASAYAIEKATKGEVTAHELCTGKKPVALKRKRAA